MKDGTKVLSLRLACFGDERAQGFQIGFQHAPIFCPPPKPSTTEGGFW